MLVSKEFKESLLDANVLRGTARHLSGHYLFPVKGRLKIKPNIRVGHMQRMMNKEVIIVLELGK